MSKSKWKAGRNVEFLDKATLDLIYKLTIRSVFEYWLVIYYNSLTQNQQLKLSQVQYRAARLCSGALYLTSQVKLQKYLSWEYFSARVNFLSLTMFHKKTHSLTN